MSLRGLAGRAYVAKCTISELENGLKSPSPPSEFPTPDDEESAIELARRVAASDVGSETLAQIEAGLDDLATAYPKTPPGDLLDRVRRHFLGAETSS